MTPEFHDRPRNRDRCLIKGRMLLRGLEYGIVIRNLSEGGAGVHSPDGCPETGQTVELQWGQNGQVKGEVRWSKGRNFGVEFERPLSEGDRCIAGAVAPPPPPSDWKVESRHRVYTPEIDPSKVRRV